VIALSTVFKEVAEMVIDQGTLVDRIDYNMEQVVTRMRSGLKELEQAGTIIKDSCSLCTPQSLVQPFLSSAPGRKVLFLDYDGTLTPLVSSPHLAIPSKRLLDILDILSKREDLDVCIVSGRPQEFLSLHFGHFNNTNVSLVAEHGYKIKRPGQNWDTFNKSIVIDWKTKIIPYLELYVKTTPGSFIEEKRSAVVWHYRQSDLELGLKRAADLVGQLSEFVHNLPVEIHHGKKIVEVSSMEINKGQIVKSFLEKNQYTAALCAGDDSTDETMFRIQDKKLFKVKVGDGDTAATHRWPNVMQMLEFLGLIAK